MFPISSSHRPNPLAPKAPLSAACLRTPDSKSSTFTAHSSSSSWVFVKGRSELLSSSNTRPRSELLHPSKPATRKPRNRTEARGIKPPTHSSPRLPLPRRAAKNRGETRPTRHQAYKLHRGHNKISLQKPLATLHMAIKSRGRSSPLQPCISNTP